MKHTDTLYINDLIVPCIIGVFDHERKNKQNVIINVALTVNTQKAGQTDDITDTVSYHDLSVEIIETVSISSYKLIEKLAQVIADICLKDKRVQQVTVHVEKPKALALAKSSAIEITRTNE